MPAQVHQEWDKGTVIRIPKFVFPRRVKPKYCILLEPWDNQQDTVVVVLTTSDMKYKGRKGTVIIPAGTLSGLPVESLVDCDSLRALNKETSFSKAEFIGQVPKGFLDEICAALRYARVDPVLVLRVRGIPRFP